MHVHSSAGLQRVSSFLLMFKISASTVHDLHLWLAGHPLPLPEVQVLCSSFRPSQFFKNQEDQQPTVGQIDLQLQSSSPGTHRNE